MHGGAALLEFTRRFPEIQGLLVASNDNGGVQRFPLRHQLIASIRLAGEGVGQSA